MLTLRKNGGYDPSGDSIPAPGYLAGILVGGTLIHCQDLLVSTLHDCLSI